MERPLACIVTKAAIAPAALAGFLTDRFPSWWVPRHYAPVEAIPRTATGKIDKKALRALLDDGTLVPVAAEAAPRSG
jgi:fatty-acyl-CoA synthase